MHRRCIFRRVSSSSMPVLYQHALRIFGGFFDLLDGAAVDCSGRLARLTMAAHGLGFLAGLDILRKRRSQPGQPRVSLKVSTGVTGGKVVAYCGSRCRAKPRALRYRRSRLPRGISDDCRTVLPISHRSRQIVFAMRRHSRSGFLSGLNLR